MCCIPVSVCRFIYVLCFRVNLLVITTTLVTLVPGVWSLVSVVCNLGKALMVPLISVVMVLFGCIALLSIWPSTPLIP